MNRLIFVPQFPVKMRYQEWFLPVFEEEFKKEFDEVIVLGETFINSFQNQPVDSPNVFSNLRLSAVLEQYQIREFIDLDLKDNDILFLSDLSYPGFFSNVLYHKRPDKCFAFCHATSRNAYDIFQPVRKSKWLVETGHSKLFDKVFVASEYHEYKLKYYRRNSDWMNVVVTALPYPPFKTYNITGKVTDIISAARPSVQKVNKRLEKKVEKRFRKKIRRKNFTTWDNYYRCIGESKIMLITSKEETFGYQVVDAVFNSCVPVAPNKFSYPELLPREYLYDNEDELFEIIYKGLGKELTWPILLNHSAICCFFQRIIKEMKDV